MVIPFLLPFQSDISGKENRCDFGVMTLPGNISYYWGGKGEYLGDLWHLVKWGSHRGWEMDMITSSFGIKVIPKSTTSHPSTALLSDCLAKSFDRIVYRLHNLEVSGFLLRWSQNPLQFTIPTISVLREKLKEDGEQVQRNELWDKH